MNDTPAFPMRHLPAFWADWTAGAATRLGVPADYVAAGLLAALSAAAGGRIAAEPVPGWREPLDLWLGLVGSPHTGKSRALDAAGALCGGGSRPARPEELARWLGRRDNRAAPSLAGEVQPHELSTVLADDTLASRFLYVWPERPAWRSLLAQGTAAAPDTPACLGRIAGLVPDPAIPLVLPFNAEALGLFDTFCAASYEEVGDGDGESRALRWLARAPSIVARLSLALVLLDWCSSGVEAAPKAIAAGAVQRAIALYDSYFRPQAMRVLERSAELRRLAPVERVLRWLSATAPETVSREEVRRGALGQSLDAAGVAQVMSDLEARGVLVLLPRPEGQMGRPSDRWAVCFDAVGKSESRKVPPPAARRPVVTFEMPEIRSAADLRPALTALARQAAEGKLSIVECQKMTTVVKTHKDIIDLEELTNRLTKIEKAVEHDRRVYAALPKRRTP